MSKLLKFLAFEEVAESRRLQALLACLLFYCFLIFRSWAFQPGLYAEAIENLNFMPMWPMENFGLRPLLPAAIHQRLFTLLGILALMGVAAVFAGRYLRAAFLLLPILTGLELLYYLHDLRLVANFFHVHLYLVFFFVLSRQKLIFFRLALAMVYWLAALVKLTPSWLWGEYFNSVPAKLPLFPQIPAVVTAACLTLLVVELISPFCWLSEKLWVRNTSTVVLMSFHLYSGVIVGHWYPTLMVPVVLVALVPFERSLLAGFANCRRHQIMIGFLALFLAGGLWNFLIPGDVRTTAEGRYHGLFMFDANRRVTAELTIGLQGQTHRFSLLYDWPKSEVLDWKTSVMYAKGKGPFRELREPVRVNGRVLFNPDYFRRNSSRIFSDPYLFYFYLKNVVQRFGAESIELKLDQQLDGHSEVFRILHLTESDLPGLTYNSFTRNDWIRLPGPDAPEAYIWP